jgi:hypothetical protein
MADLVYLEEELPEIEIKELVSNDEIYEYSNQQKKGINVYSDEDILQQLILLLQSHPQAKTFQELHKQILKDTGFIYPDTLLPEAKLQRKDNGDEDVFFENYDEAKKIQNYYTRAEELRRIFLGYETTDESAPRLHISIPTRTIANAEQIMVLPEDALSGTVTHVHHKHGISPFHPNFIELDLPDKIKESQVFLNKKSSIDNSKSIESQLEDILEEKIPDVLHSIKEIQDIYDYSKEFMRHSVELTDTSLTQLYDKLIALKKKDKAIYKYLKAVKSYKPKPFTLEEETGAYLFYKIQHAIFKKLVPIFEVLQTQLLTLYQTYLDSTEAPGQDNLPTTAYDLALLMSEQKVPIEEVISILKRRLLFEQYQHIQDWLTLVKDWNLEQLDKKVEFQMNRFEQTRFSIFDEPKQDWLSVNEEIKQVKKGEVISKYFEEDAFIPVHESTLDFAVESDDPAEITLPLYVEEEVPFNIESLDEGRREVFTVVLKLFTSLQKASGLPLDIQKLFESIPMQLRKTKLTHIQEQLPELSPELQVLLSKAELDQINDVIESTAIRTTLKSIYDTYLKDIEYQYTYLLSWWICHLQNHVLNRTLNFEIWKGSLGCIDIWTPYGAPMEGFKLKRESMLSYLVCVITDLQAMEGTSWNRYTKLNKSTLEDKILKCLETDFLTFSEELQERFKTFDKDLPIKKLQQKGETIKKQISETVEKRNKQKYLSEYMAFLKNLPSILIQSSIAKRIYSGCCLQLLSDKYRSDYDWASYVKDAYKLKKLFATQRMTIEKRPKLVHYYVPPPEEEVLKPEFVSNKEFLVIPKIGEWTMEAWNVELETFMPFQDYVAFNKGVQNLIPIAEKYLSVYHKSIKETLLNPFIFKETSLQTLMELYRKVLELQKRTMEEEFIDLEDELTFLREQFNMYQKLYDLLLKTTDSLTEVQDLFKRRVLQYFIVRQLCFPAKPEFARNSTLVLTNDNLSGDLLPVFLQTVYDDLKIWMEQKQFQKSTNFADYISKMREQENNSKLKIIDKMNPEERKLYVEAKKLGILELQDYLQEFQREPEDDYYITNGENNEEADMDRLYDDEI